MMLFGAPLSRRFYYLPFILLLLLALPSCNDDPVKTDGSNTAKEAEQHPLKTALDKKASGKKVSFKLANLFEKQIVPILEQRCGVSCHGVDKDAYQTFLQADPINRVAFYFPFDAKTGKIQKEDLSLSYEVAVDHDRVDYSEEARFSHFLRAPLAEEYGGEPHRGLDVFYSSEDADYKIMEQWINSEIAANKKDPKPLPENITYFEDNILGLMERNSCFLSSCHGSQVFNDLKLIAPLPGEGVGSAAAIKNGFSRKMVLANRDLMLGKVSRLANLGGDLEKSRLIVKNLPISQGGIHQRGGNNQFFESIDDADVKHLLSWMKLERKALASQLTSEHKPVSESDLGKIKAMAFIRGPRHTPRTWFSFDEYYPGSDIFLLPLSEGETLATTTSKPVNLTAAFHQQPVEIQSLDVRYDAKRIIFSMRKSVEQGFRLYELNLNDEFSAAIGKLKQISFASNTLDDGTLIHHIDPVYSPGPNDKEGHELGEVAIAFISNEAGQYAQSDTWGVLGEADGSVNDRGLILLDKQRPEIAGSFDGRRLSIVAGPNKGEWRTIVKHRALAGKGSGARLVLDRALPKKVDRQTVYVIEKEKGALQSSFDLWRFIPESVEVHADAELKGLDAQQRFEKTRHQMTFTYAQERRPSLRSTGETMITSVRNMGYQGDKPIFNGAIYRLQAGGFDYHIQGGNRSGYALYSDSRELGNGLEIRQLHDPRNLWNGGLLALVDHGFGVNMEPDNPLDDSSYSIDKDSADIVLSSPPRFIPAQVNFFDEYGEQAVTHTGVSPGGSIREPFPLLNGSILTSYTDSELNHLDANADPDWDLYIFEFVNSPHTEAGNKVGEFRRQKIMAASTDLAEYSARPVMVRLKEKAHRPLHHQKFGSRSDTIKPKESFGVLRMPDDLPGEIECYDFPLLQSFLTNFAPVGAKDFRIQHGNPNGSVTPDDELFKYVRVLMQLPTNKDELKPIHDSYREGDPFASSVSSGIHNRRVIVSEAPIEDDGSIYLEVPTNVPLILQGLNSEKMAMHNVNRWFYLQPGEKLTFSIPRPIFPLRCAGCHGSLTGDPVEGIGPVDLVSASSRVMATWNEGELKRRKPYGMNQTKDDYISVDFRRDVQPILNKHCVACHQPGGSALGKSASAKSPANLDLRDAVTNHYNVAYESLNQLIDPASGNYAAKRFVNEREALASESLLIETLRGEKGASHLKGKPLSKQELLTLIRWIDLGATFKGGEI